MRRRAGLRTTGAGLALVLTGCHPVTLAHPPDKPRRLVLTLKTEGGFAPVPGLTRPIAVDTAELPDDQARELDRLVRRAAFFTLPARVGRPRPGAADLRTYELTVSGAPGTHTVRATEPVEDPALAALIQSVEARRTTGGQLRR